VTLNITVVTPTVVYQSADFRLTDGDTGDLVDDHSNKTVTMTFPQWGGFLTYTGLGRYGNQDMSHRISQWLENKSDLGPLDVAELLRTRSDSMFSRSSQLKRFWHTYILGSFHLGKPQVFLISNFQSLFRENSSKPSSSFEVSSRTLRNSESSLIIVTGNSDAVSRHQRAQLKHATREFPTDGGRMRRLIGRINAEAAQSKRARDLISRECSIMSLHMDGTVRMQRMLKEHHPRPS
jgi:hypothetical protein